MVLEKEMRVHEDLEADSPAITMLHTIIKHIDDTYIVRKCHQTLKKNAVSLGTAISSNASSLKNFHFEFLTPSMGLTVFPNFVRSTSFPQCIIQDGSTHIYNNNIAGLDKFEQNFNQRFFIFAWFVGIF